MSMTMQTAHRIVEQLRAHGFTVHGGPQRPVLALAEEAGEFVGAYRRFTGLARRAGTAAQMHAELADVVITAYVTAAELGIDLDTELARQAAGSPQTDAGECHRLVLALMLATARFVEADLDDLPNGRRVRLGKLVRAAYTAADAVGCDLDAAITTKLAVVFTRGWRESTPDGDRHTVVCGWGCGVLAASETELDEHEATCDRVREHPRPATMPPPRAAVLSAPRRGEGRA
jgi:NTP pyrophosphatase (non-canonical NTP hydrolase)